MNAKQKRTLLILLTAVVLLIAVLLGVRASKNRAQQAEQDAAAAAAAAGVITDAASSYQELSYHNGNATLSFALNDEGSGTGPMIPISLWIRTISSRWSTPFPR